MNLEFQTAKHLESSMKQWPFLDRKEEERRIRSALLCGQAWLYPEWHNAENQVVAQNQVSEQISLF